MKISKSKQELARIISENGGWRDGAEWSIQDSDKNIEFMTRRPEYMKSVGAWYAYASRIGSFKIDNLLPNFHQTILSRAEYFHLYPAPDADGWIEWKGGECPVGRGTLVDVKYANGVTNIGVSALTDKTQSGHVSGSAVSLLATNWGVGLPMSGITAYRLHKPEQLKHQFCESVMRSIPEPEYKPSIEQLMQIHCDRAHALSEKKAELLVAERQESEALDAIKAACKEAGFDISPVEKPQAKQDPEPVITDWRDLQVGDEIELTGSENHCWKEHSGREMTVTKVYQDQGDYDDQVDLRGESGSWSLGGNTTWRFIRRP